MTMACVTKIGEIQHKVLVNQGHKSGIEPEDSRWIKGPMAVVVTQNIKMTFKMSQNKCFFGNGEFGNRTRDFVHAKHALYQLS